MTTKNNFTKISLQFCAEIFVDAMIDHEIPLGSKKMGRRRTRRGKEGTRAGSFVERFSPFAYVSELEQAPA
jgi:hypothetical protein